MSGFDPADDSVAGPSRIEAARNDLRRRQWTMNDKARIVAEAVEHYHEERPHQSKGNTLLIKPPDEETEDDSENQKFRLHCNERLGGLLKHYYLKAA